MSRHRKIKALDLDEEYDDYYNALDDDDEDFDEDDFQAKYLSTGINLDASNSSNKSKNEVNRQAILDDVQSNVTNLIANKSSNILEKHNITPLENSNLKQKNTSLITSDQSPSKAQQTEERLNHTNKGTILEDVITTNLTKIAIEHLDKHQWQLPLMDMDKKFRDRTYYKHYTDTYISSLRSKLGHFLADNQLVQNSMRYHVQQELDNYSKYSRMFTLLTEYYQSIGTSFFSFATPSPDEEIVIGCRLGTKVKKPISKQTSKQNDNTKTARYEYSGKQAQTKSKKASKNVPTVAKSSQQVKNLEPIDITIREDHTAEELEKLTKKYEDSLNANTNKTTHLQTTAVNKKNLQPTGSTTKPPVQPKQLETLNDKRHNLKQQIKRNAEPSQQDREAFKKQAIQTAKEYSELIKSTRPRINLVVVGHVDAGKSTLVGHLLYKMGQVTNKQMHRNEVDSQRSGKASFKYAWALDETAEERARGVTIDIALTQFDTANREVVLLDAPGHVDFIPAVISGAAQADAALLVVDATRGEFETGFTSGGQTREHTFLVRSLGVKSIIVVVNKMDNVDWSWGRFSDIIDQIKPFLKQVGFNIKDDVQFVVCSGLTGENLTERRIDKTLKASSHPQLEGDGGNWQSIPSLLEAIDKIKPPERMVDKPTRVCITDVFKGMSSGVFLGAKVVSGKLENKQKLLLMPSNENCEIKQVETRDNRHNRAFAGDIVTTVATGIDMNKYYRGCILCDPFIPCQVTNRFQARIIMFQEINSIILIKGSPIEVHINGTFESGEVRKLISLLNKNTGELVQKKPRCITKNSSAIIQLRLTRVVCCDLYQDNKDLGRFMMRSNGKTIAAGLIVKIKSAKIKNNTTKLKNK